MVRLPNAAKLTWRSPIHRMVSGNYDYPPASNRADRNSASDRTQQSQSRQIYHLQNLRDFLSERERGREPSAAARGLETLIQEVEQSRLFDRTRSRSTYEQDLDDSSTGDQAQRRGRNHEQDGNPGANSSEVMEQESDPANSRPRIRWLRPSDSLSRLRANNASLDDELSGMQQIAARIREANATITSVLGEAFPRSESPMALLNLAPSPYPEPPNHPPSWGETRPRAESPSSRWRAKRRKLDSDDHREGFNGFSYGHYGQVVPGLLKMEIASCDGGSYYDDDGESSWPGNVLLDDSSVYCTKKSNCNLILKHRGGTPFCLKRIVIKAPKKGFDAAIQEGMVFVSMTSDELLERTSQYQIYYSSRNRRDHRSRRQYAQPSQEYMNAYRSPLQAVERSDNPSEDLEPRDTNETMPLAPPSNIEPQFRVTTENDDNSEDGPPDNQENNQENNDGLPPPRFFFFNAEGELLFPEEDRDESDGGGGSEDATTLNRGRFDMRRRFRGRNQHGLYRNRLVAPSRIEPVAGFGESNTSGTPEVMKPHARFFIEREKSMVNIKFDPPPSGRFVLVKLWSPYSGGNIDIESIMLHGYSGTRYFASLEPR
ncbi:hypothetical protein PISL3812_05616 [Talaromyces islandicus]|uniref:Uncharacterized protein n=1 Tax=Talaromyces islandicus TaxID=28573 RepID=A0A0U1LZ45_TALIS|nr:hypothetical protein PISL3812_05616 [Talaromyces islandicus]